MNDELPNESQPDQSNSTELQSPPPASQPGTPSAEIQPQGPPQHYAPRPPKDRSIAIILEILPGLFGILGIGWIYAENTAVGILILVLYLLWNAFSTLLDVFLGGFFLCIHIPFNIACLILSPVLLYNYTKQHPELFGP
ncbi:MAG: hypothetical protein MUO67_20880 [Anaerolineales bacterium]|nr:hypothetical protein [Anaerolineales bacterium]